MNCSKCGNQLEHDSNFCYVCGAPVELTWDEDKAGTEGTENDANKLLKLTLGSTREERIKSIVQSIIIIAIAVGIIYYSVSGSNKKVDIEKNTIDSVSDMNSKNENVADEPVLDTVDEPETEEKKYEIVNIGDTISTDFVHMSLEQTSIAREIYPMRVINREEGGYGYMAAQDGEIFFYLTGDIINSSNSTYNIKEMKVQITFDNIYNYSGWIQADAGEMDLMGTEVAPGQCVDYYLVAAIPNEVADSFTNCQIQFAFNENFEDYYMSDLSQYQYCYELNLSK